MDQNIEELVLRVRADTSGFARDVAQMRGETTGASRFALNAWSSG